MPVHPVDHLLTAGTRLHDPDGYDHPLERSMRDVAYNFPIAAIGAAVFGSTGLSKPTAAAANPSIIGQPWGYTPVYANDNTTQYTGLGGAGRVASTNAAAPNRAYMVPQFAGTISKLYIRLLTAQPAGVALTVKVYINGSATAVAITVAASTAAGTILSDTTNSVSFVSGDKICLQLVEGTVAGTPLSATLDSYGVLVTPTGGTGFMTGYAMDNEAGPAAGATKYYAPFGFLIAAPATEATAQCPVPIACTLTGLTVVTDTTQPATGTFVFTVRKNGADTAIVATVTAGATRNVFSTTGSVAFAAGDLLSVAGLNNASTTACDIAGMSFSWTPDVAPGFFTGQSVGDTTNGQLGASRTRYTGVCGLLYIPPDTAEAEYDWVLPSALTMTGMYFRTTGAQPASGTQAVTVRKNHVDTTITKTLAANDAAGTYSDAHNVAFALNDYPTVKVVNGATTSGANIQALTVSATIP